MSKNNKKKVSIVMGSQSDFKTMIFCEKVLKKLNIKYETKIISAHRTPDRMYQYAKDAEKNNIGVIIAGAGGSAHLPGMISALTSIPVLGVPIESKKLKGLDSLLSIAQMPKGIPVGTLAIGEDGAINAALLAASIIGINDLGVKKKYFFFTPRSFIPIIDAANNAALIAPSSPIAKVPTGIPFGIWAIDKRLSSPLSFLLSIGTPKTGIDVSAEIIPGKWAEPPAPAIITPILFFSASLAYWYIRSGVRWADMILVSYFIFNFLSTFSQNIMVLKSDWLPITIDTFFLLFLLI